MSLSALTLTICLLALYLVYHLVSAIYIAFFGPLSKFPGPRLRALTNIPEIITLVKGNEATELPRLHEQYGPVVRTSPNRLSYAGDARIWKDIHGFKKAGQEARAFKDPSFYIAPFNGVHSLFSADDANHSRQRKLLTNAFADKTLKDLEPMLKYWVGKLSNSLRAKAGEKIDMLKAYNCTTFDIMGDLSFNEGLGMLENGEYSSWVQAIFLGIKDAAQLRGLKLLNKLTSYIVDKYVMNNPKVRTRQAEHWNNTVKRVDRRLKKTPERADLWSTILQRSKGPNGLSIDEHHSIASLFMTAGTETTATALSGTTYHLLQNPEYLAKLNQEIRDSHSSFDDITLDSLQHLKYLKAVFQEGLRMYPPVPTGLPRKVPQGGCEVNGEWLPGGTIVGVHQFATYRSKDNFKDPYSFRPERWLGDPKYQNDNLDALEPFHVGPRNCLGKNLAWHEMRLILATVLLQFDLELCDESQGWDDQKIYTTWEKKPLICRVTPYNREQTV